MFSKALLVILCLIVEIFSFDSVCRKLSVSTDITSSKDDVVKEGVTSEHWTRNTPNPEIVTSSTMIDYLYFILENYNRDLEQASFNLDFTDHYFADSKVKLESKQTNKNIKQYSLEINYRCREYGGALIDYELDINIPECGKTKIYWKKICGNPLIPREGLTIDIEYGKYNQSIVSNGALVDANYFDSDLDNYVFQIPSNIDQSIFYLYMNLPKTDDTKEKEEEKLKQIEEENQKENKKEEKMKDNFEVLEAILKLIPEVSISAPIVDADVSILKPEILGPIAEGGLIVEEPQKLILQYNCFEKAETTIELSIPLDYFRDINLIFIKKCFMEDYIGTPKVHSHFYIKLFFFVIFILVIWTVYNHVVQKKRGFEAIPIFNQIKFLRHERLGSSNKSKNQYQNAEEEDVEYDIKIERDASSKYGSL